MEKSLKDRLVVHVLRIPEDGLTISESMPREWLTNIPEFSDDAGTHIEGPIRLSGRLTREGDNLRLFGRVEADLATFCTRCGAPVTHPLRGDFEIVLVKGREQASEEMELTPEDLDRTYYDGIMVDLAPFYQEEVAIEAPVQVLCRKDCAGLCPHCGRDLNLDPCGCRQDEGDPRLAVLRKLKIEH
jgi:uncharacterized protein